MYDPMARPDGSDPVARPPVDLNSFNVIARADGGPVNDARLYPDGFANAPPPPMWCFDTYLIDSDVAVFPFAIERYAKVELKGSAGDTLGIAFFFPTGYYLFVAATVTIGAGTSGRLALTLRYECAEYDEHTAEQECAANEYNVPADEWVTLTVKVQNTFVCGDFIDAIYNVELFVPSTGLTHTLGYAGVDPAGSVALITRNVPSAAAQFNNFEFGVADNRDGEPCDPVIHCCITEEADYLGCGTTGWTIVSGTWNDVAQGAFSCISPAGLNPATDYVYTSSTSAKRTIDYQWLNDNLRMFLGLGEIDDRSVIPARLAVWFPATETVWRMYFSKDGADEWYIEARFIPTLDTYGSGLLFVSLEHNATIVAWIAAYGGWGNTTTYPVGEIVRKGAFPALILDVHACTIAFGLWGFGGTYFENSTGGTDAEAYHDYANKVQICVEDNALNRTGHIGIGTGSPVDVAGFHNFSAVCRRKFDCTEFPATEEVPPDDPDDPTGCCDGWGVLQTGDPAILTLSSWAHWLGPGCADPGCSTSDFLTALNADHSLTLQEKTEAFLRFVGNLGIDNPCDDCEGLLIRSGPPVVKIRLHLRAEVIIEKLSPTECQGKAWIRGRCADCVWYFESNIWTPGADCTTNTWTLISGNASPGGYDCCLQASSMDFQLP